MELHALSSTSSTIYRLCTVANVPSPAFFAVACLHGPHLGGPVRRRLRELEQRHRRFLFLRGLRLRSRQHGDVNEGPSALPSICETIKVVSRFGRASKVRARFHVASASISQKLTFYQSQSRRAIRASRFAEGSSEPGTEADRTARAILRDWQGRWLQ